MNLLEIRHLVVRYGVIEALHGINIDVEQGTMVALLGANGAGKSTVLKAVSGLVKPVAGSSILLNGVNISGKRAHAVSKMGLSLSPEGRQIFSGLTVEENLRAGAYGLKRHTKLIEDEHGIKQKVSISAKAQLKENFARVYKLFPVLEERKKQQASTLSGGEQQMLAVARALMNSPKILVLDEPSLGLAPLIIQDIFNTLVEIKKQGTTILIVEQNALATLKIADFAYVLELGNVTVSGPASELVNDQRLIDAYLGGGAAKKDL